ncbi:MAG: nucleotidyltransferase domain-containing protein [Negativicutes bacterium]|nr:nucleotidyltransferase domain-containing protein [Negativicutes bacterium]
MNANSYLGRLATSGLIRELEKVNIDKSLSLLQGRLDSHFGQVTANVSGIKSHFVFGSYTRGTMLPRSMDPLSDVDYMVIFDDTNLRPQSCLARLKRFVEKYYRTSEIFQSHPTIILSLSHVRFEMVPAIETFFSGIQIPTKGSLFSNWASTSPNEFNKALTGKNKSNYNTIKPLIRLLKYWNVCNRYPFDSFELENHVVTHWTVPTLLFKPTLWRRFRDFIGEFSGSNNRQNHAIERARRIIAEVFKFESEGRIDEAVTRIQRLLPPIC